MLLVLSMTNKNHAGWTVTTEDALVLWLYKLYRPMKPSLKKRNHISHMTRDQRKI